MDLDVLELLGIATGLIAAALFVRYVAAPLPVDMLVVALAVGPFVLRAARRARGGNRRP
ncbi:MAG: hypothetical protein ABIQ72_05245 [Usitatibacter sp.]